MVLLEAMLEQNIEKFSEVSRIDVEKLDKPYTEDIENNENEIIDFPKLTDEQISEIKEETGWSDEITECINSIEEVDIYQEAGLIESNIGEKTCLIRPDIDMEQKDGFGRTNKERMEQGLAPLTPEGRPYELHHIGQHSDSPLAELTMQEHRGKGNDGIMHNKTKESEIDRNEFNSERAEHWQNRAEVV